MVHGRAGFLEEFSDGRRDRQPIADRPFRRNPLPLKALRLFEVDSSFSFSSLDDSSRSGKQGALSVWTPGIRAEIGPFVEDSLLGS